jgi:Holliday junction resolvasome RuvABC endonuclease subunit
MKKILFVGIDYSYTSPAITVINNNTNKVISFALWHNKKLPDPETLKSNNLTIILNHYDDIVPKNCTDIKRYMNLAVWSINNINQIKSCYPDHELHIAIEGYSLGSRLGSLFNIAENTAILKYKILTEIIPDSFEVYPPTTIKKYATGKGNSKKPDMARAYTSTTGDIIHQMLGKTNPDSNPASDIVDSYFIASLLKSNIEKNLPKN